MPIAGATRFRQWAFSAAQSAHGTASTPSGAFPWRGTPTVNPNWQNIDVDTGTIDPLLLPFPTARETTATLAGPLDFNSLNIINNGGVRGGVTPTGGGAAKTWVNTALSTTATTLDEFTAQWTDDYTADGWRYVDGIVEKITYTYPEDLGPVQVSVDWYFGTTQSHTVAVSGLTIQSNLPLVFGADTALYIDSAFGSIGSTQISSALHNGQITITNTIDKKRFMNGSNSRFAVAGYTLAAREIEATFTFAKTDAIVGTSSSELRNLLNSTAVTRYLSLVTTSPQTITGTATAYSWTQNFAGEWRTPTYGEMGGNSTVTLMLRGRHDVNLGYPYKSTVVNDNAALP